MEGDIKTEQHISAVLIPATQMEGDIKTEQHISAVLIPATQMEGDIKTEQHISAVLMPATQMVGDIDRATLSAVLMPARDMVGAILSAVLMLFQRVLCRSEKDRHFPHSLRWSLLCSTTPVNTDIKQDVPVYLTSHPHACDGDGGECDRGQTRGYLL